MADDAWFLSDANRAHVRGLLARFYADRFGVPLDAQLPPSAWDALWAEAAAACRDPDPEARNRQALRWIHRALASRLPAAPEAAPAAPHPPAAPAMGDGPVPDDLFMQRLNALHQEREQPVPTTTPTPAAPAAPAAPLSTPLPAAPTKAIAPLPTFSLIPKIIWRITHTEVQADGTWPGPLPPAAQRGAPTRLVGAWVPSTWLRRSPWATCDVRGPGRDAAEEWSFMAHRTHASWTWVAPPVPDAATVRPMALPWRMAWLEETDEGPCKSWWMVFETGASRPRSPLA